ncbi:MAG: type II toxin-antitoxin system HicA family toxin [Patescibacteria group bacterium]
MPKLRRISGSDLIGFLEKQGFILNRQKGSHMILSRIVEGVLEHLVVPNHKELDRGMTHGIYKQAREYLPEQELKKFFYTE